MNAMSTIAIISAIIYGLIYNGAFFKIYFILLLAYYFSTQLYIDHKLNTAQRKLYISTWAGMLISRTHWAQLLFILRLGFRKCQAIHRNHQVYCSSEKTRACALPSHTSSPQQQEGALGRNLSWSAKFSLGMYVVHAVRRKRICGCQHISKCREWARPIILQDQGRGQDDNFRYSPSR